MLRSSATDLWRETTVWVQQTIRQCRRCRDCDQPVRLLDEICSHCGSAHPARVPVALLIAGLAAILAALLIYHGCRWFVASG